MTQFIRFCQRNTRASILFSRIPMPAPRVDQVLPVLSVMALTAFGFLFGAAVMFFQLPSSDYLRNAFVGAIAWYERGQPEVSLSPGDDLPAASVAVDQPDKTFDGFTLYTTGHSSSARLVDMHGKVVHQWALPFSKAWPIAPHVRSPLPDNQIHWFRCHLYANGDLLAVYHADGDTPYGYGLAKLDKDSRLLWTYSNLVHHDVAVDEAGRIYTLTQKLLREPPAGLESLYSPFIADSLVVLSPQGEELDAIPLLEALSHSSYAAMLSSICRPGSREVIPASTPATGDDPALAASGDILHANSVRVLSRRQAAKYPLFKAGQVLVSLRTLHAVVVVDPQTHSIVWAAQGMWRCQHDAEFLDNGHLLLYDNLGSHNGARILEYDPSTQAVPWSYGYDDARSILSFSAFCRGMKQRLANDNTLIVNPEKGQLFEVNANKELVWKLDCPFVASASDKGAAQHTVITGALRYAPGELTFLDRVRPRP